MAEKVAELLTTWTDQADALVQPRRNLPRWRG